MKRKIGVVMDAISSIDFKKDSTLAMLWEAQDRGYEIFYFEQKDLFVRDGKSFGNAATLNVFRDEKKYFELSSKNILSLSELDVILMRKDPPFDQQYIYTTYILECAEKEGVLILNRPAALRDANEKFFTINFPDCCPPTLITRDKKLFREFLNEQREIICKPLEGMGGRSVFHLTESDINASVIYETLTQSGTQYMMLQRFIPEIKLGDKRIILINGEPIPFALARIPASGELRGNLVAGAKGVSQPLTEKDKWICEQVAPVLREKGLYFVGLDVIGNYLTEINVTSPTGIRQLDEQCNINISKIFFDFAFIKK